MPPTRTIFNFMVIEIESHKSNFQLRKVRNCVQNYAWSQPTPKWVKRIYGYRWIIRYCVGGGMREKNCILSRSVSRHEIEDDFCVSNPYIIPAVMPFFIHSSLYLINALHIVKILSTPTTTYNMHYRFSSFLLLSPVMNLFITFFNDIQSQPFDEK